MKYADFLKKKSFSKTELLAHAYGNLITDPPEEFVKIPAPPMLMLDRIMSVEINGTKGSIIAEKDIAVDEWFFHCHFRGDPVQPGCLGVDAIWQLLGFYLGLKGATGSGRALGCKEIEFMGQIRPYNKLIRYELHIRRYSYLEQSGVAIAIGTGNVFVDDELIYIIKDARVGLFKGLAYSEYPFRTEKAVGGIINKNEI
jgi:3-hydroxyacyl-[acyl-carrier protein] dehydratase/trans-2-decenoyl-[acyl-carrier protein] isomerase